MDKYTPAPRDAVNTTAATPSITDLANKMEGFAFRPSSSEPTIAIAPTQNSSEAVTNASTKVDVPEPFEGIRPLNHSPIPSSRRSMSSASPMIAPAAIQSTMSKVYCVETPSLPTTRICESAPPRPIKNEQSASADRMVFSKRWGRPPLSSSPSVVPNATVPQLTMVPRPIIVCASFLSKLQHFY